MPCLHGCRYLGSVWNNEPVPLSLLNLAEWEETYWNWYNESTALRCALALVQTLRGKGKKSSSIYICFHL
jgi:hypothetical protein